MLSHAYDAGYRRRRAAGSEGNWSDAPKNGGPSHFRAGAQRTRAWHGRARSERGALAATARPHRHRGNGRARTRSAVIALLDVNVLLALFDPDQIHHDIAHDWFADGCSGWASCPLTENGYLRTANVAAPKGEFVPTTRLIDGLRTFQASSRHEFWN